MTLLLLSTVAFAADAYYDPDQVAAGSELFAQLASQMGPWYEDLQNQMTKTSLALEGLDAAALLAANHADDGLGDYAQGLRKQAAHQYLQVQRFADVLAEDTETTFGAALDQALAGLGFEAVVCQPQSGAMMGPMRGMNSGGSCEGKDVSAALSSAMDQDPGLQAAVAEIQGLDWPGFVVEGAPQSVISLTGTDRYVALDAAAKALLQPELDALERGLEDQLAPLEDQLTKGAEGGVAALAEAEVFRTAYEAALAAEGDRLLAALTKGLKKEPGVGVCANPAALGGCAGTDVTQALLPVLVENKKVQKAL